MTTISTYKNPEGAWVVSAVLRDYMGEYRKATAQEWTVWVGGTEVNENYLTYGQAVSLAEMWTDKGYDDVQVERVTQ